jgi:hypothetical protein
MTYHTATATTTTTTEASGESLYPVEGVDDDAMCHTPSAEEATAWTRRILQHLQGGPPRRPGTRRTAAMEVTDTPAQEARSPLKKTPPPDIATCRGGEVAAAPLPVRGNTGARGEKEHEENIKLRVYIPPL